MSLPSQNLVALVIARATTLAYPELLPELARALQVRGMHCIVRVIEHEHDADAAMAEIEQLEVAGVIAAARPSERQIARAADRGLPLLLYNCHAQGPTVDSVSCDHAACGHRLASLLLGGGASPLRNHRIAGGLAGRRRTRRRGDRDAAAQPRVLSV